MNYLSRFQGHKQELDVKIQKFRSSSESDEKIGHWGEAASKFKIAVDELEALAKDLGRDTALKEIRDEKRQDKRLNYLLRARDALHHPTYKKSPFVLEELGSAKLKNSGFGFNGIGPEGRSLCQNAISAAQR